MPTWIATLCAASLIIPPAFAQAPAAGATPTPPVVGVIQSFDGHTLVLETTEGSKVPVTVPDNVTITRNEKRTVADIKPGDFIASGGTRGPDGKIHANEIRIFTAPHGEGQFPMAQPNQVMTNATVTQVMTNATVQQVGGTAGMPVIKLTFHGAGAPGDSNCTGRAADAPGGAGKGCVGQTEFEVPPDTPVVAQVPGDRSMLKTGAKASLNMSTNPQGTATATRITVSDQ